MHPTEHVARRAPAGAVAGRDDDRRTVRALDSLRQLVRALRLASAVAERDLGVSAAQLFALRQIAAQPGQSLSELARRTLTSQSSISEVVARLVSARLVRRATSPADGRRAEFTLTASGADLARRAPETIQERLVSSFRRLSEPEQTSLSTCLPAWLAAAGLSDTPATMFLEPQ